MKSNHNHTNVKLLWIRMNCQLYVNNLEIDATTEEANILHNSHQMIFTVKKKTSLEEYPPN